jgi:PAP2 superfamily
MTSTTFDRARAEPGVMQLLIAGLRAHTLPLGLCAALWLASYLLVTCVPGAREVDFESFALAFVSMVMPTLLLAIVTVRFVRMVIYERPGHPIAALIRDVAGFIASPGRLATGLPMVISLTLLIEGFSRVKYNIPVIQPFDWDRSFDALDRTLHFGRLPWEWLQPVLGYPLVTFLINVNYNLWFMVMWCLWVMLAFTLEPGALRMRFFLTFILAWAFGGGVAAVAFSSAGPAYYSLLGLSPDPYAPLMAYLDAVGEQFPLWALDTQKLLWQAHIGEQNVVAGISAMPSMHNGSALLFALVGFKLGRQIGLALSIFAVLIFLGSVHLGWHYAVDAYLGWAITLAAWWICGPIARWNQRQSWTTSLLALMRAEATRTA